MKNQNIVISLSTPEQRSMTVCIDQHSHISEWEVVFRSMLTLLEFSPRTIDELFASSIEYSKESI
jgi:hypothetical protein